MSFVSILLARAGSKRIKNKAIVDLGGKPLIAWVIQTVLKSKISSELILSTDSEKIASIAKTWGASVYFLRPKSLATDTASAIDALYHAINWCDENLNYKFENVAMFQLTSPFLKAEQITKAYNYFIKNGLNSLSSAKKVTDPPQWMFTRIQLGNPFYAALNQPDNFNKLRHELKQHFIENGAFYFFKKKLLLEGKNIYSQNHALYLMDDISSLDIDEPKDLMFARFLLKEGLV